ncbi:Fe-S protein assembly co-chaperone HscB [Candidatus Finniella inopinata]|uniref:Fe-S protein assembly co-chaperone HscB n=1 Tax=Candidatus Finniella inopinata TaxID=1696036 RepID=A0A4Q7DKU3_9PROT|nr:Fe-S protein assembly co-chaperone HscB [Candidatus Finniella inopinata]RZI47018.1 Fe-S protein assembly co-chaperone HscB [Candidatus Finniella inopinata]
MTRQLHNPGNWDIESIRPQATPFALLSLLPAYSLDMEVLERHYLILQRELHPDRFINKSPREAQTAEMMSAWINRAYTTLKDPVLRAKALLKIKGCMVDECTVFQDNALLEEAMEWRQRLEELQTSAHQKQFQIDLQEAIKACEDDFSKAWDRQDQQALQTSYLRLSYLMKTFKQGQIKQSMQAEDQDPRVLSR